MANTYHQIYLQTVFAVKYRNAVLAKSWRSQLFGVIGNLINEADCKTIIVNGVEDHVHCFFGLKPVISVSELMKGDGALPEIQYDVKNDVVVMPYSSGTTGLPKGVMLTHHNLTTNVLQFIPLEQLNETSVMLAVLPFFHIYAMTGLLNGALAVGGTVVSVPRFDLEQVLGIIQQYKVTNFFVAPPPRCRSAARAHLQTSPRSSSPAVHPPPSRDRRWRRAAARSCARAATSAAPA